MRDEAACPQARQAAFEQGVLRMHVVEGIGLVAPEGLCLLLVFGRRVEEAPVGVRRDRRKLLAQPRVVIGAAPLRALRPRLLDRPEAGRRRLLLARREHGFRPLDVRQRMKARTAQLDRRCPLPQRIGRERRTAEGAVPAQRHARELGGGAGPVTVPEPVAMHDQRLAQRADLGGDGAASPIRAVREGCARHEELRPRAHHGVVQRHLGLGPGGPELPERLLRPQPRRRGKIDQHQRRHAQPALAPELEAPGQQRDGHRLDDFHVAR